MNPLTLTKRISHRLTPVRILATYTGLHAISSGQTLVSPTVRNIGVTCLSSKNATIPSSNCLIASAASLRSFHLPWSTRWSFDVSYILFLSSITSQKSIQRIENTVNLALRADAGRHTKFYQLSGVGKERPVVYRLPAERTPLIMFPV